MTRLGQEKSQQALRALRPGDLWMFVTQEGSDPATKLVFDAGVSGSAAFLLSPERGVLALVANYDTGHVRRLGVFAEVRDYERSFTEALGDWLAELAPTRLLLNFSETDHLSDGLTHGQFRTVERVVRDRLDECPIESSASVLARVRGVKSAEEQSRLRTAIEGSVELYRRLLPRLTVGRSEREIQAIMRSIAADLELEVHPNDYGGPLVLITRAGIAHRGPGDDRLEPGDTLILDHALGSNGYYSDVARTIYVRRPGEDEAPEPVRRVVADVYEAISAAFAAIRPGRAGHEIDAVARTTLLDRGCPEITHATGHQIGRHVHDGGTLFGPRWERYGDGPNLLVETGQVFTIEPTVLRGADPSALVEENVVVTEDGATWLTERQEALWVV